MWVSAVSFGGTEKSEKADSPSGSLVSWLNTLVRLDCGQVGAGQFRTGEARGGGIRAGPSRENHHRHRTGKRMLITAANATGHSRPPPRPMGSPCTTDLKPIRLMAQTSPSGPPKPVWRKPMTGFRESPDSVGKLQATHHEAPETTLAGREKGLSRAFEAASYPRRSELDDFSNRIRRFDKTRPAPTPAAALRPRHLATRPPAPLHPRGRDGVAEG